MFKIMKEYKIFAFTPSGKSLKKTLWYTILQIQLTQYQLKETKDREISNRYGILNFTVIILYKLTCYTTVISICMPETFQGDTV